MNHNGPHIELHDLQNNDQDMTEDQVLRAALEERRTFKKLMDLFEEYIGTPCSIEKKEV